MKELFQLFDNIRPLSAELRAYLLSILVRKDLKRKQIILKEGQTAKYIYFIEKGLVRCYRSDKNGRERTSWLMKSGDLFVSVGSFFSQTPTKETIETLGPCIFHCISFEELEYAYKMFPEFNLHGRLILQYYYKLSEDRNHMKDQKAPDKFEYLMANQPDLVGKVPDKYLASYLGITPGTFSLQKSNFANRHKKSSPAKKYPPRKKHTKS